MDFRAVIFIPALAASAICIFFFLTFAAHYYLTILEGTAAGGKRITWFPSSFTENFVKPFYLAWLIGLWLGPAYIFGKFLTTKTGLPWFTLAVPVFVAWALYPVSQLSSLSALSVWIPLHPQVFARLIQKPRVVFGFFAFTLPVFALAGLAFKWAFLTEGEWHLLLIGVPLLIVAGFLYARLLGRLAFALMFTRDLLKRKKKKPAPEQGETQDAEDEVPAMVQPSEMAPINTPDGELAGYNVLIADDLPVPKKRVRAEVVEEGNSPEPVESVEVLKLELEPEPEAAPQKRTSSSDPSRLWTEDDDDATPYDAQQTEATPEEHSPLNVVKPRDDEMALLERKDRVKPPKVVWNAEVFAFLLQPGTISAWVVLCGLGMLAGAAVRVARMFNPLVGAE